MQEQYNEIKLEFEDRNKELAMLKEKNQNIMEENQTLSLKFNNNSKLEKEMGDKIQKLQSQCENIINQRSQEFKNKLKTIDEHANNLKIKNEKLSEELLFYKKY